MLFKLHLYKINNQKIKMQTRRKLSREEEQVLTLEYLCGLETDLISNRHNISEASIRSNIVPIYSREYKNPLIEFYRTTKPDNRQKNAAHLYLSFRGRDVPKKELVSQDNNITSEAYSSVDRESISLRIYKIVERMWDFFIPSNGYERLIRDVLGDARSLPSRITQQIFEEELFQRYLSDERLSLDNVSHLTLHKLADSIKQGGLATSPKKIKLIQEALSTLPERDRKILSLRYNLENSETGHTYRQIGGKFKVSPDGIRKLEMRAKRSLRKHNIITPLSIMNNLCNDNDIEISGYQIILEEEKLKLRGEIYQKVYEEIRREIKNLVLPPVNILKRSVQEIGFGVRVSNILDFNGINTIEQLLLYTSERKLMSYRNFGLRSLNEVKEKLAGFGLRLDIV